MFVSAMRTKATQSSSMHSTWRSLSFALATLRISGKCWCIRLLRSLWSLRRLGSLLNLGDLSRRTSKRRIGHVLQAFGDVVIVHVMATLPELLRDLCPQPLKGPLLRTTGRLANLVSDSRKNGHTLHLLPQPLKQCLWGWSIRLLQTMEDVVGLPDKLREVLGTPACKRQRQQVHLIKRNRMSQPSLIVRRNNVQQRHSFWTLTDCSTRFNIGGELMGQIRVGGEDVLLDELCGDVLVERDERLVILERSSEGPTSSSIHAMSGILDQHITRSEINARHRRKQCSTPLSTRCCICWQLGD